MIDLENIIRRWFNAIAWFFLGICVYKYFDRDFVSKLINIEKNGLIDIVTLLSILAISYIFLKSFFIASMEQLRLQRFIKFPPYWLTFWAGYIFNPIFFILIPQVKQFSLIHYKLILPLIFLLNAFDWISIIAYVFRTKIFRKEYDNHELDNKKSNVKLRDLLLSIDEYARDNEFCEKLMNWSRHQLATSSDEDDLIGCSSTINFLVRYIEENIRSHGKGIIGLLGPFGSGKSSLIELVVQRLLVKKNENLEIIQISCWEFETSEAVEVNILNKIISRIRKRVFASNLLVLSNRWIEFIKGVISNKYITLPIFFDQLSLESSLNVLAEAIEVSDIHLLIILEDVDRNNSSSFEIGSLQRFLERLKMIKGITVLIATNSSRNSDISNSFDLNRLLDRQILMPSIELQVIEKLLSVIIFTLGTKNSEWDSEKAKHFPFVWLSEHNAEISIDYVSAREFSLVASTPRKIKKFIATVCIDWDYLQGKVNFFDFFLITFIKIYFPEVLHFLIIHIDVIRQLMKNPEHADKYGNSAICDNMKKSLEDACSNFSIEEKTIIKKIIAMLFEDISSKLLDVNDVKVQALIFRHFSNQRITQDDKYWKMILDVRID